MQAVFAENLFLHQRFTESHINAAFGLPFHEQRIEGAPAIVRDPNFVYLDFARSAVAVKLDDRGRKTVGRRGADSRAFKIARILRRPVAAGGAEGAVFSLGLGHRVSEAYATFGEAWAANLTVGEFEIVRAALPALYLRLRAAWV